VGSIYMLYRQIFSYFSGRLLRSEIFYYFLSWLLYLVVPDLSQIFQVVLDLSYFLVCRTHKFFTVFSQGSFGLVGHNHSV